MGMVLLSVLQCFAGDFKSDDVCQAFFSHTSLTSRYSWKVAGALDQIPRPKEGIERVFVHKKLSEVAEKLRNDQAKILVYAPSASLINNHAKPLMDLLGPAPNDPRYQLISIKEKRRHLLLKAAIVGLFVISNEMSGAPMINSGYDWMDFTYDVARGVVTWGTVMWLASEVAWLKTVTRFPLIPSVAETTFIFSHGNKKRPQNLMVEGITGEGFGNFEIKDNGDYVFQEFLNREGQALTIIYGLKARDSKYDPPFQGKRSNNDEPFLYVIRTGNSPEFEFDERPRVVQRMPMGTVQ